MSILNTPILNQPLRDTFATCVCHLMRYSIRIENLIPTHPVFDEPLLASMVQEKFVVREY